MILHQLMSRDVYEMQRPTWMRRLVQALFLALSLGSLGIAQSLRAEVLGAREVVQTIVDETVAVLRSTLELPEKRAKISAIADANFDFETMGRLTLAKNWARFSPAQQADFLTSFRTFLGHAYGKKFDQYQNESVKILGQRGEARGDVTVQTHLLRNGGENIAIDYRLRAHGNAWRIIDVTIEGVSLVSSYRSQFQEILENGSPDELLRQIHEKNAQDNRPGK